MATKPAISQRLLFQDSSSQDDGTPLGTLSGEHIPTCLWPVTLMLKIPGTTIAISSGENEYTVGHSKMKNPLPKPVPADRKEIKINLLEVIDVRFPFLRIETLCFRSRLANLSLA
jgi:hypothetical protein